jgi:hypothetical protein
MSWATRSKLALAVGLLLAVAACGPRYKTYVAYTPPETTEGRQCLLSCQNLRMACRQQKDQQVQECRRNAETQAQLETVRRIAEYAVTAQNDPKTGHLPRDAKPNYSECASQGHHIENQCSADHDLCYQNCGGRVTYSTHCVANCE